MTAAPLPEASSKRSYRRFFYASLIINVILGSVCLLLGVLEYFERKKLSVRACENLEEFVGDVPVGVQVIAFEDLPGGAKPIVQSYFRNVFRNKSLCVYVRREISEKSYELFFTNAISLNKTVFEMDIIEDNGTYRIEELETEVELSLIEQTPELQYVEDAISKTCKEGEEVEKIELSDRNHFRIPGEVITDDLIVYEFECIPGPGKTDDSTLRVREFLVKPCGEVALGEDGPT